MAFKLKELKIKKPSTYSAGRGAFSDIMYLLKRMKPPKLKRRMTTIKSAKSKQ